MFSKARKVVAPSRKAKTMIFSVTEELGSDQRKSCLQMVDPSCFAMALDLLLGKLHILRELSRRGRRLTLGKMKRPMEPELSFIERCWRWMFFNSSG